MSQLNAASALLASYRPKRSKNRFKALVEEEEDEEEEDEETDDDDYEEYEKADLRKVTSRQRKKPKTDQISDEINVADKYIASVRIINSKLTIW